MLSDKKAGELPGFSVSLVAEMIRMANIRRKLSLHR